MSSSQSQPRAGKIITFYSYKGGTGRTMALANAAWILASQGRRVLAIDWDLEAPGLHRYFHPFLEDKELTASPGLIDYFYDVLPAARVAGSAEPGRSSTQPGEPWWQGWTSWLRYTHSLDVSALAAPPEARGSIDFIPAGRQGADYGERVSTFDWKSFYERLGGGTLLEAVKRRLRARYDYVLIDSRTGISDTSGICTVQMPDELVVCFTLNKQSMAGAAAAASSAAAQRAKPDGTGGLKIWPVPTRIELGERDRLEAARTVCRGLFWEHLGPLLESRDERDIYWGKVEVLYQAYFAYEEVLAVFSERRHQKSSMLASLEFLVGCLSTDEVLRLGPLNEGIRAEVLRSYVPDPAHSRLKPMTGHIFISYSYESRRAMTVINGSLRKIGIDTWVDREDIRPGESISEALETALKGSGAILAIIGPDGLPVRMKFEIDRAIAAQLLVVPVLVDGAGFEHLPRLLHGMSSIRMDRDPSPAELASVSQRIAFAISQFQANRLPIDPEDPQKGQWGGQSAFNDCELSATVVELRERYYAVELSVRSTATPLTGTVTFHLHRSFKPPVREVPVENGIATLHLVAWGAFTVGAEADGGKTRLELDLSKNPEFPAQFRAR